MYKKFIILILIFSGIISPVFSKDITIEKTASLSGVITDKATGEALPGVSIYLPDLKTGALSDTNGKYFIDRLPSARVLVKISFIGYQLQTATIDLSTTNHKDFSLEESVTEISEVVVTGQSESTAINQTPSPIALVSQRQLAQTSSTNIIDALSNVPGVSQITTGSGISKPVIRGLGYNRVVVVNDGIRQEGQQWGDEHGIEIDAYDVNHVEILKGPASLAYGSDAMAGVINMLSAPSLPDGHITGNIAGNYQTNNGLYGTSVNLAGNQKGFIWDARLSNKMAHAYENKYDGSVYNSGFREHAASLLLGVNRAWGFSHLKLSLYHLQPGMVEGERDSQTGKFTKEVVLPNGEETTVLADHSDFKSYHPDAPFQKIDHYKAVWNNRLFIKQGKLQTSLGFQQNRRKEFEEADNFGLYFQLNTFNYDARYISKTWNNWKFTAGINGMWQQSKNKGSEFLVPAYHLFDAGIYSIINKQLGAINFSGGLRFDQRTEKADALYLNEEDEITDATHPNATERFSKFNKTFNGFSGSIGASWQINESTYMKLNLSRGFRAPNIAELGSNGEHEGTFRYEIGNTNLKPENSLQIDWTVGMNTKHISTELSLFDNHVSNYIFTHKLNTVAGSDSIIDHTPVFKFSAGDAHLYGFEFRLDIHPHPLDWLHFENSFSYLHSTLDNQPDSMKYLPFTPPTRWISDLKIESKHMNRFLSNSFLKFGFEKNWKQNHFYKAFDTETSTPGYFLFNLGAGTDIIAGRKKLLSLYVSLENLTNKAYQNHLSRLKYSAINPVTGRTGVYNMGRNLSIKLLIPIDL